MRVAISHEWLTTLGGSERVVEALLDIYPGAPVYTSFMSSVNLPETVASWDVRTSFVQKLPYLDRVAQRYIPLFPLAFESFDFSSYDLVISSSSACAKGILTGPGTTHVCYCHTPLRYAWEPYLDQRFRFSRPLVKAGNDLVLHYLRLWDRQAADRVDHFIANSSNVAAKIAKYYRREAAVIHPPVDVDRFSPADAPRTYFLVISRLVSYKRVELAVEAFTRLGLPLKVAGDGPERERLRQAAGPNIEFLGYVGDEQIQELLAGCLALVFPGEEDFGIVPVEAMAAGRPVIGFGRGGLTESVVEGRTGLFFEEPTAESLIEAVSRFSMGSFDARKISRHAEKFSRERFKQEIAAFVAGKMEGAGRKKGSRGR
ncbi:MAG: glycosyltransferase family 4 protein [Gaiellales bacterium]|nr:MAG: glycosyltransferase family 4 protein [Gaiellales bacterium]